jgi:hypothetical protein
VNSPVVGAGGAALRSGAALRPGAAG